MGRLFSIVCAAALISIGSGALRAAAPLQTALPRAADSPRIEARALLDRYCVTCHSTRLHTAGLDLQSIDVLRIGGRPEVWEKVVRKLRGGLMPPAGLPRPNRDVYDAFASTLEQHLDRAAGAQPNPGRTPSLHRLNRIEYQNAIRDLLALDVNPTELLPSDEASYGFDNIASVLKISQAHLERYLSAARRVSRLAVGSGTEAADVVVASSTLFFPQYERMDGLPFGTRGGILVRQVFPQNGEYVISIVLGEVARAAEPPDAHQLEVTIDGERAQLLELAPKAREQRLVVAEIGEPEPLRVRLPITAGPHEIGITFPKSSTHVAYVVQQGYRQTFLKATKGVALGQGGVIMPWVEKVTIGGPFKPTGPGDTPSRRAIFTCRPATAADEEPCAKRILARLARRAYRRSITDSDLVPLLNFYREGRSGGFESGIERALGAILVSPEFWYRIEGDPPRIAPGTNYRLDDLQLASRLSFFLWSSIPDDMLLDVAARGALSKPAILEQQVRRMLADPRARVLTTNFAAQWLQLANLDKVTPIESQFPDFDEGLQRALRQEMELFVDSIRRDDRSVLELLDADYTFVNERVARHYGIPNVIGSHFRRVALSPDDPRRGLLGKAAILTLTSHPTRTSPVKRGKWMLDVLLGTPPPPPPPNVPDLPEAPRGKSLSVRELMAAHRANPVCASCHSMIDPGGFALENFDAIGRFRTIERESGAPIDASGVLPDGTRFDGLTEFRAELLKYPERFVTTMTEKLLTYALGRGVEYYDAPAIRRIVRDSVPHEYRYSSLILGVVKSVPFQWRRSLSSIDAELAAPDPARTPTATGSSVERR